MRNSHRITRAILVATLLAATSLIAQPYYVRGSFNSWDTSTPMTDNGGGVYSATFTGAPGTRFDFKVATADWSSGWPGDNTRTLFDASGSATVNFRLGAFADGWSPATDRVGYVDPGQFGWEVMGSFNSWASPVASLAPMGGGLYSGTYLVPTANTYSFKFREAGSWDISIGFDFRNPGGDSSLTTTAPNQLVSFQLDLPNGRWSAAVVPEPATLSLFAGGAFLLLCRRGAKKA
jgi:hypothetical protein